MAQGGGAEEGELGGDTRRKRWRRDVGYMNDLWRTVMGFSVYSLTFLLQHFLNRLHPDTDLCPVLMDNNSSIV